MKALTVRQPWASLIMFGGKDVENRTWPTKFRGRLAIHAGTKFAAGVDLENLAMLANANYVEDLPLGVVLGTVELVDCVRDADSPWAFDDHWHWILADPKPYRRPIARNGALGLWSFAR